MDNGMLMDTYINGIMVMVESCFITGLMMVY